MQGKLADKPMEKNRDAECGDPRSTGFCLFVYAVYHYMYRAEMHGLLQGAFFFGYMFLISYGFFLLLGAIGYWTSVRFVRYIYSSIKMD